MSSGELPVEPLVMHELLIRLEAVAKDFFNISTLFSSSSRSHPNAESADRSHLKKRLFHLAEFSL